MEEVGASRKITAVSCNGKIKYYIVLNEKGKKQYLCLLIYKMMKRIAVKDRYFELLISDEEIQTQVKRVAEEVAKDMADKNPLFIVMLNGAFMFASDLMKHFDFPCELSFVKYASYEGMESSGQVKELIGLKESIRGRHVVIVEDIVETGYTIQGAISKLKAAEPADIRLAACLSKPEALRCDIQVDYCGFEVGNLFLVGYGLDYDAYGRNLKDIYIVSE